MPFFDKYEMKWKWFFPFREKPEFSNVIYWDTPEELHKNFAIYNFNNKKIIEYKSNLTLDGFQWYLLT